MINNNIEIRTAYADRRRKGLHRKTMRVILKTKSRFIA